MTSNQIRLREAKEKERSNRHNERETNRSNLAKESETVRSNKRKEELQGAKIAVDGLIGGGKMLTGFFNPKNALMNDPSWYNQDAKLVEDVARFPFGRPLGLRSPWPYAVIDTAVQPNIPGVCAIYYTATPGEVNEGVSGAQTATNNIYAFVRHKNSGSSNYEAVDLMMYLLSMDSLYTLYAWGCRMYSLLKDAKTQNRYYPWGFFEAMGIASDTVKQDWLENIANLRYQLNSFGVQLNAFAVPRTMPYFNRHIWMNTTMFKDREEHRSQVFMFTPEWIYEYEWEQAKLTGIRYTDFNTYAKFTALWKRLIDKMLSVEDVGIMSGDIIKAYGEENLFKVESIPDEFHVEAAYSLEVLSQITNTVICGEFKTSPTIAQQSGKIRFFTGESAESGILTTNPTGGVSTWGAHWSVPSVMINMYKDTPTPDDVMVATRLCATIMGSGSSTNAQRKITNYGTEIVNKISIAYSVPGTSSVALSHINVFSNVYPVPAAANIAQTSAILGDALWALSSFDWAPNLSVVKVNTDSEAGKGTITYSNIDYANFVVVDGSNIDALHQVACLSEFGVPVTNAGKVR